MKNRVTLHLEDIPYRILRVMAAEDNKSMSDIAEELLVGKRRLVSDEEEIKKIEEEHDVEVDSTGEVEYTFDGKKMKKVV